MKNIIITSGKNAIPCNFKFIAKRTFPVRFQLAVCVFSYFVSIQIV